MFGTFIGVSAGVFIRVWANILGKQRLLARPWNHVLIGSIGGYVGFNYQSWEENLLIAVNEKRKIRSLPEITRENVINLKY